MDLCADCGPSWLDYVGIAAATAITVALCWAGLWCYRRSRRTATAAQAYIFASFGLYGLAVLTVYATLVGF